MFFLFVFSVAQTRTLNMGGYAPPHMSCYLGPDLCGHFVPIPLMSWPPRPKPCVVVTTGTASTTHTRPAMLIPPPSPPHPRLCGSSLVGHDGALPRQQGPHQPDESIVAPARRVRGRSVRPDTPAWEGPCLLPARRLL